MAESYTNFRSIDELVKMFDREKALFRDMFERRKSLTYRTDFALEIVDYKKERLQFLIDHGVIHEQGDFLELEDVYVRFFEDVLDMNEEISVAGVSEYIESLRENINYFLDETNEHRKQQYRANVRKILRRIGLRTLKNVVDLKRSVESAYKQEPNYKIKKARLANLDEKRKGITLLMHECERILNDDTLFRSSGDVEMQRTCMDVRNDFTDADHNLLEIERQIIDYLNRIEQQSRLYMKIRRLKYLKDQLTWREDTDVVRVLHARNPLWMEKRPYNRTFLSLDMLRSNESMRDIIRRLMGKARVRRLARTEAEPIGADYMAGSTATMDTINTTEMIHAFRAQSSDLFTFIRNYNYRRPRTTAEHVRLYGLMAADYAHLLRITDRYETYEKFEYALIYAP